MIPRDRDQRVTTAPPPGSRLDRDRRELEAQRAELERQRLACESWEDSKTPIDASDYERMEVRTRAIRQGVSSVHTLLADLVGVLVEERRAETEAERAERLDALEGRRARRSLSLRIVVGVVIPLAGAAAAGLTVAFGKC